MKKHNLVLSLLPLVLVLGAVGGFFLGRLGSRENQSQAVQKLATILNLIENEYVDGIDVDSLLEVTFPELLASLDPHSAYIPASDLTAVNDDLAGSFSGVGVSFQIMNDTVAIVEVVGGGPAEKVGLLPGDLILKADTTSLAGSGVTNEKVFSTLRGKEGTTVKLEIKRSSSSKPLTYDVVRGKIPDRSINSYYMIAEDTGYVKVSKFARNTYSEFLEALLELTAEGAGNFIIDLRGNSGGFMDQAIYMVNEFLEEDNPIVFTKGRNPQNNASSLADGRGSFRKAGVIVLTDEYSASASEIFAGAIQDNDRGLVIGRRTFGKGLVQNQTELPDSSAVRLTVARYYTPSGRSIQKEYKRGESGLYEMDIAERYTHGEFYNADSIKFDKSKIFKTLGGRTVYGGGGIMPDIFVPSDTLGVTSYYLNVTNAGLIQKYAYSVAGMYRKLAGNIKDVDRFLKILPRDETLLNNFVEYASQHGVPARWYYINRSQDLLLNQLKAVITRDLLGYDAFIEVLNRRDPTIDRALKAIVNNESPKSFSK